MVPLKVEGLDLAVVTNDVEVLDFGVVILVVAYLRFVCRITGFWW